jgi:DNA-binding beta-propeller fold protein YncE
MNRFTKLTIIVSLLALIGLPALAQQSDVGEGEGQNEAFETSCRGMGVFANVDTNSIQFIDPATNTLSPRHLQGYLGKGALLDVVTTSDGRIAIVSSFTIGYLYFLDISGGFDAEPRVIGRQFNHFPPEDLAITPDDKYVLVTDGGHGSAISVIEIANHRYVLRREIPGDAQAIAISPDGQTVIVADFWGGAVHT